MKKNEVSIAKIGGFCAFFALMFTGLIALINLLLSLFDASFDPGILTKIANVCLVVAVIISGWIFKSSQKWSKKLVITILFWVFAALALFGSLGISL